MKTKLFCTLCLSLLFYNYSFSQVSGNQAYQSSYYNNQTIQSNEIILFKDSALIISAKVLLNTMADVYMVTLGVNQEGKTIKECNELINKRIDAFKTPLKKLTLNENDVYTDFISQSKIYDYEQSGNKATQYLKGFEIKKNIIIRINNLSVLEQLLVLASEFDIFDIVKCDYIVNDVQKIYNKLNAAAIEVIKNKKDLFSKIATCDILPSSKVYSENFYSIYPKSQYKKYQAYESSNIESDYNSNSIRKEARKSTTFYYDGINQSGFDIIINPADPVVGIQFIMDLKIKYDLKKGK